MNMKYYIFYCKKCENKVRLEAEKVEVGYDVTNNKYRFYPVDRCPECEERLDSVF